jgi:hypothetical protein
MRYFVELSIPDTDTSMGFYLYGDTPESVTPEHPFVLSDPDAVPYKGHDNRVMVVTIDATG